MKGNNNNKKKSSIFDNCHETASQEIFLRSCGFAQRGAPPDSDPSVLGVSQSQTLNNETAPPRDSVTDSVINSGYEESHAVRLVSPPESPTTTVNRTVPDESRVDLEESGEPLPPSSTPEKKVKVPLRDVVKAIVMNSRGTEEREVEKKTRSCVQVLVEKGFNFN